MPCTTGVPTSQPAAPTFPFRLFFWTSCARASLSPLSTANMNFTSLWPAYQAEILLYSGAPSVADVPTSTNLMPAFVQDRLRAVDPRLDVPRSRRRDDPGHEIALLDAGLEDLLRDRCSCGQVVLADVGLPVVRGSRRDVGVVGDHGDAVAQRRVDGLVEGGVVDETAPDAVRLPGDRGVERRDHLVDDRGRRAGPLVRAAGQGACVLDPVDRRREERVRRHVVDHHELVLRMAGEDRVVAVALVGRRARPLLAQDLGQPAVGRSRHAGVAKEASPREVPLPLTDLMLPGLIPLLPPRSAWCRTDRTGLLAGGATLARRGSPGGEAASHDRRPHTPEPRCDPRCARTRAPLTLSVGCTPAVRSRSAGCFETSVAGIQHSYALCKRMQSPQRGGRRPATSAGRRAGAIRSRYSCAICSSTSRRAARARRMRPRSPAPDRASSRRV